MLEKIRQHFASPINKKAASITALVLIVLAIPLTVFISQQQQEIRQRAQEVTPQGGGPPPEISLALSPATYSTTIGSTFNSQLSLTAGSNNITGVDVTLPYNKDVLEVTGFEPASTFNNQLVNTFNNQTGTLRYSAVNTQSSANGTVNIGTITFRAKAEGTSAVTFDNIQITALDQTGSLPTSNNTTGSYTVAVPTVTSAPQPTEPVTSCSTLYNRIVRAMGKSCGDTNYDSVADLNRDRRVSNTDYSLYLTDSDNGSRGAVCDNYLGSTVNPCAATPSASPTPVAGDANGDGVVDILDFNIWRDEFLGRALTRRADFNRDGRVDLLDFAIWRNAVGGGISPPITIVPTILPSPTPTPTPSRFGMAAKFARGTTTDAISYIAAQGSTVTWPEGPMTMEAWLRVNERLSSSDNAYLIYKQGVFNYPGGETLAPIYYLQLRGNRLTVHVNDIPRGQKGFINATLPPDEVGVWHHVAGVYDGQKISIFIDGILKAETGNLESQYPFIRRVAPFYVGGALLGQNVSSLPVILDDVRISNIARYTTNFQRPTEPFVSDSTTLLLWHLDTMEGGIVRDSSPYGTHGGAVRVSLVDSTVPSQ